MNPLQDPRNRRALIILAIAVVAWLAITQGLAVYDRVRTFSQDVAVREDQLRRYRRALERRGNYDALIENARNRIAALENRMMASANPALASAELQATVEEMAQAVDIGITRRSVIPVSRRDDMVSEIGVSVAFESTPAQLVGFLSQLRQAPRAMGVTALQVSPVEAVHEAPENGELHKRVRISMTVTALLRNAAVAADGD